MALNPSDDDSASPQWQKIKLSTVFYRDSEPPYFFVLFHLNKRPQQQLPNCTPSTGDYNKSSIGVQVFSLSVFGDHFQIKFFWATKLPKFLHPSLIHILCKFIPPDVVRRGCRRFGPPAQEGLRRRAVFKAVPPHSSPTVAGSLASSPIKR